VSAAKYVAVAAIAARQGLAHRALLAGRSAFYVVLLLIFSRLWRVVLDRGAVEGAGAKEMLWYLAITEWVVLGAPLPHQDVERDVRTGQIAYGLPRPISYVGGKVAENVGSLLVRMATLGVVGFVAAWALAGGLPDDPRGLWVAAPLALLAAVVCVVFGVVIGVSSFWLQDASPVYWVWQKLTFVLGGLILPLSIYPGWLRDAAQWTPFPWLLYGPARFAFGGDAGAALATVGALLAWGAVATGVLVLLYRRGLRVLDVNGG
jgi:ABC-2 type transport system permease protein